MQIDTAPTKCEWINCGQMFKSATHCYKHIRSHHLNQGTKKCEWSGCKLTSTSRCNLANHVCVHLNIIKEVCFVCNKYFKWYLKSNLGGETMLSIFLVTTVTKISYSMTCRKYCFNKFDSRNVHGQLWFCTRWVTILASPHVKTFMVLIDSFLKTDGFFPELFHR